MISDDWEIVHDEAMNEPYAYILSQDNLWTSYEDPESVRMKVSHLYIFLTIIISWVKTTYRKKNEGRIMWCLSLLASWLLEVMRWWSLRDGYSKNPYIQYNTNSFSHVRLFLWLNNSYGDLKYFQGKNTKNTISLP